MHQVENNNDNSYSPLKNLRVIDLTAEKGELCGRILGDFGADVLKVEPPEGSLSRSLGPFADDGTSIYFAYRNLNKRSCVIDLDTENGIETLLSLIRESDVLIESFLPGTLSKLGISPDRILEENASLVIVSLTDFGQTGPDSNYVAKHNDLIQH